VLLLRMPESVRFMIANGKPIARIRVILARISDEADNARRFVLTESAPGTGDNGLGLVLSRSYIVGSLMLWLAAFMGLLIIYALMNWMPILLKDAGLGQKSATLISALFPLGGVGAVLCGALMDRFNANLVIAVCYALAAISLFCIGETVAHVGLLVPAVVVCGVLTNTAQSSMNALAAAFYPTEGRGTGVAWMTGMACFGGIAGSFLVAELVRWHFTLVGVFATIAVAGALSCVALLVKQLVSPHVITLYAIAIDEAIPHVQ
jgi:AAHS family 4-hydroxybenzoate transporter-like MFS transporter